jgi:histone acetyltransferase (RNA polymerase elongator complex component)
MNKRSPDDYTIESGPMGPIGESESLILRVNRNCPWNRCLFCSVYKGRKYSVRSIAEIKADIDTIRRICDLIESASYDIGLSGGLTHEALMHVIRSNQDIYGKEFPGVCEENWKAIRSLNNVANWMLYGGKRVFLQDSNALAMQPEEMIEVLRHLKESLDTVETVTSYARSKTCAKRSADQLAALRNEGLSWLLIGMETGSDRILNYMKKGVTRAEHLEGICRAMDAGIDCAVFVMPGIAGSNLERAGQHMRETIDLLNEIEPTEVRVRSLAVLEGSPLHDLYSSGDFKPATEDQMIEEIRMLLEELNFNCTIETYQMTNVLFNIKGELSDKREEMLARIKRYQSMPPIERVRFRFNRYLNGGYVNFIKMAERYDSSLEREISSALTSLEAGSDDAIEKAERAIFTIKSRAIP